MIFEMLSENWKMGTAWYQYSVAPRLSPDAKVGTVGSPMITEKVESFLMLSRPRSYDVKPAPPVDVFVKRLGSQVVCMNLLICADWVLQLYALVQLTFNSLFRVELKLCT